MSENSENTEPYIKRKNAQGYYKTTHQICANCKHFKAVYRHKNNSISPWCLLGDFHVLHKASCNMFDYNCNSARQIERSMKVVNKQ
jgi:hypothetical protein